MPKSDKQKIKLFRLYDILKKHSDNEHPLSTQQLLNRLKEEGIVCTRKTLYQDIKCLTELGYEIMPTKEEMSVFRKQHGSKGNLYYVSECAFETYELRILLDAVQSAAFITKKKTKELEKKISNLAGPYKAELLRNSTVRFDANKHNNENIFYLVDSIDSAIALKKQISFFYFSFGLKAERVYKKDEQGENKKYLINPLGLIFTNGFYYLIGYNDEHKKLTNYRIDRMDKVQAESSDIVDAPCAGDFESYKNENLAFNMFSGRPETVTLFVLNDCARDIYDKFGLGIKPADAGDGEHFIITVRVQITPVFLSWCIGYGDKIKIISPKIAIDDLVKLASESLSQYK